MGKKIKADFLSLKILLKCNWRKTGEQFEGVIKGLA
jgi:hypothetical protein